MSFKKKCDICSCKIYHNPQFCNYTADIQPNHCY